MDSADCSSSPRKSARLDSNRPNVLLLGMVYAHAATAPKRGQEFRDRVRCHALSNLGYRVFTLDDKHDDEKIPEHVRANFADSRRMLQCIRKKWSTTAPDGHVELPKFKSIMLDYFFCPLGWARTRWDIKFFRDTLPLLASEGLLLPGGTIWLPNLPCISGPLDDMYSFLSTMYAISVPQDYQSGNPLYEATDHVEDELKRCPDILTNETQVRTLLTYSDRPFICLTLRSDWWKNFSATNSISSIRSSASSLTSTPVKKTAEQGNMNKKRKVQQNVLSEEEQEEEVPEGVRRTSRKRTVRNFFLF